MIQRRDTLISVRKGKGLTQKDVVQLLKEHYQIEISESYYGMIEQGVRTPKLNIAVAICKIFDKDVESIFFDSDDNKMLYSDEKSKSQIMEAI